MSASLPNFSQEQATSTTELLDSICNLDQSGAELKREFVTRVNNILHENFRP